MKKSLLLSLILLSGILLTACDKNEEENVTVENPTVNEECKIAVENYLE
jgi:hypothetical protein